MIIILISLICFGIISLICFGIWVLICNEKTFKQLNSLLAEIRNSVDENSSLEEIEKYILYLDNISYGKHLWYNITLRDPSKLYKGFYNGCS